VSPPPSSSTGKKIALGCGIPIVLFLLLLGGCAVLAGGGAKKAVDEASRQAASSDNEALSDVTITKCALDDNEFLGATAELAVLNHSSKPSSYIISIVFESPDGTKQLGTGTAILNNVGPNQTATDKASTLESDIRTAGKFNCKIASVSRTAS